MLIKGYLKPMKIYPTCTCRFQESTYLLLLLDCVLMTGGCHPCNPDEKQIVAESDEQIV